MYIQPISENNISMYGKPHPSSWKAMTDRIKQKLFNAAPNATFNDTSKFWKGVDSRISRPAENRAIMGATALALQPAIDASNKKVDEKTRKTSICRTISKIVVGTLVGICVRGSAYKLVKNMTNINGTSKFSKALLPKKYIEELANEPKFLENYRSALSTGSAILAMLVTNFAIDAPLTVKMTNLLKKKFVDKDEPKLNTKEVRNG